MEIYFELEDGGVVTLDGSSDFGVFEWRGQVWLGLGDDMIAIKGTIEEANKKIQGIKK